MTDDNQNETAYDLLDDEFFVSIAPFINETHVYDIHSLTGCQGELVNEEVDIQIEDSVGNVILAELTQREASCFTDLWLPRDDTFNVTIKQEEKETSSKISTYYGDNTCIKNLQLG